jgi:DNA-binding NtrC family response regulator
MNTIRPLAEVEKRAILEAIVKCDFNLSEATARLGVARCTLYRKLREWGLEVTQAQSMKRSEMIRRCQAIEKALEEMNEKTN